MSTIVQSLSSNLSGKTALITGSSSGIGLATAHRLAQAGAAVMLHGIESQAEVQTLLSKFQTTYPAEVAYAQADVSQPDQIESLIQTTQSTFGSLDILVNNAGIQFVHPVDQYPTDKWNQIIAINLSAVFHAAKHAIPLMKSTGWGRIINIASAHGLVASPYKSAYVAAKHGVLGLTKTLALELAETGITCNAICPGYVKTPLVENQIADTAKARGISESEVIQNVMLQAQPTRDFVSMEDVAEYVWFLCQNSGKNITGSAQSIDGGWTAK